MVLRRMSWWSVTATCLIVAGGTASAEAVGRPSADLSATRCGSGAHTLSHYGDHVYPETGNGGYRSLHTDVHMIYDAVGNRFLSGNHVVETNRSTQCLTDFSLDFERRSSDPVNGPDMTVRSVTVDGRPAAFRFVQPTYPGDPKGQDDLDPRAHQAGQLAIVGGPDHNPLPPACTPELTGSTPDAQDGRPCPANKLVITPAHRIRSGTTFTLRIDYLGRPGVHTDGDGSTEGWFRSNVPTHDGGFVTTEPVGTEAWLPLNDHPSVKPTYDFYDTVNAGRTAIGNGQLVAARHNPPDTNFPAGSTTWHWASRAPVASYLVESSVGNYDLTSHFAHGVRYYEAQASALSPARKLANLGVMNQQEEITRFQSQFNGPYPFQTDGVLVAIPSTGFEEEMQTMITFQNGSIDLGIFHHENMHQWWGDNVTESNYDMTFFKEGLATLGEYLEAALQAETAAGGPHTVAGRHAFNASLIAQFNRTYARTGPFWVGIPSDPAPYNLFSGSSTYTRPGAAYIALRQILGSRKFDNALQGLQRRYGGQTITESQLEAGFQQSLPNPSRACHARLGVFFTQWFDTSYPTESGAAKPRLTGPGLDGGGFYDAEGGCHPAERSDGPIGNVGTSGAAP